GHIACDRSGCVLALGGWGHSRPPKALEPHDVPGCWPAATRQARRTAGSGHIDPDGPAVLALWSPHQSARNSNSSTAALELGVSWPTARHDTPNNTMSPAATAAGGRGCARAATDARPAAAGHPDRAPRPAPQP